MKVYATTDVSMSDESDDTVQSVCITVVIRNKDSDCRIYIDLPIYQMHAITRERNVRKKTYKAVLASLKNTLRVI